VADAEGARCSGCGLVFARHGDVLSLLGTLDSAKRDIQAFWTDGAVTRKARGERGYTAARPSDIEAGVTLTEAGYRAHGLLKREIDVDAVADRQVLEIGCGNGGMSLVLWRHGAAVVAGDLALPRCETAAMKFAALGSPTSPPYGVVQLDAERLPFPDDYFDLVVSNGVLHHTANTESAVREVFRVLKPGGRAAVMLYARHSTMYYGLVAWHGLLRGRALRDRNWLAHVTEQGDATAGRLNPVTRVYSGRELRRLFSAFTHVSLRKDRAVFFSAARFPRLTAWLRPLSPYLGWSYCISATK
jgi:ubiquinone/menaquinone biosynthesis C-methylase UbiE